jgi:hypothetical protein
VEEGDLVKIHPASINCQFHVFPWSFEELGAGMTHRSGVGVCIQDGQLQCLVWVLKKKLNLE